MPYQPPHLREKAGIGRTGIVSEKRVAKKLGARLTPASGAMKGAKGDMVLKAKRLLIEAKSTVAGSLSLKFEWLSKIACEARATGKRPALTVTFTDEAGRERKDGEWVLIPLEDWKELSGE